MGIHGIRHLRGGSSGVVPVGSWDASTSTLALLAALVSHSRTSLATMFDSTGKLTYAPNNLLKYSNTFSNVAWTKNTAGTGVAPTLTDSYTTAPDGSPATRFVASLGATPATALSRIYQLNLAPASASVSTFGIWAKTNDASTQTVYISGSNAGANFSTITVTPSWQFFSTYIVTSGAAFFQIGISGASSVTGLTTSTSIDMSIAEVVSSAVTYETTPRAGDKVITTSAAYYGPRIDYDPNTLAVKGLLIEEARTNLAINSASLSSFSPFSMTATTNFAVAPDGTSAATKLDDGTTAAVPHQVAYSPSGLSASTAYAFSVFAKQGTGRYLTLSNVGSSSADGGYAVFDLQAGTVTQSAALGAGSLTSATITPINGGWYRLSVVTVAGTNTARFLFVLGSNSGTYTADSNGRNSYTGTNNTWLVWGAQLELGSFDTSYIPTAAASVTRAADVVQFTGDALTALQGSAWSAAVQFADVASYAGNPSIFDTSSNLQTVFMNGNKAAFFPTSLNTANGLSVLASHRIAASATRSGGRSIVSDGGTVATDATAMTSPPNTYLGSNVGAGNFLNGHVASFAIYNQRLPDATLQARSVVGASY